MVIPTPASIEQVESNRYICAHLLLQLLPVHPLGRGQHAQEGLLPLDHQHGLGAAGQGRAPDGRRLLRCARGGMCRVLEGHALGPQPRQQPLMGIAPLRRCGRWLRRHLDLSDLCDGLDVVWDRSVRAMLRARRWASRRGIQYTKVHVGTRLRIRVYWGAWLRHPRPTSRPSGGALVLGRSPVEVRRPSVIAAAEDRNVSSSNA
jgi:hypothetical protein